MKLFIVRHGEPDYEKDCLTELGKKEAVALRERLRDQAMDAVYVSPLGRASETCEIALGERKTEKETCDWLREFHALIHRPDAADELNITWDWLPCDWMQRKEFYSIDTWLDAPEMRDAGVEKEYKRVCDGLDSILLRHGYRREGHGYRVLQENTKSLYFFCHFGVGAVLLSHLLSISPMLLWHGLVAAPASVTEAVTEERRKGFASFRVNHYGDTSHLEKAGLGTNINGRFTEIFSDAGGRHD